MTDLTLTKTRLQAGVYEGVVQSRNSEEMPQLEVRFLEKPVGEVILEEDKEHPQTWSVKIHLPPECLTDGVQTFLVVEKETQEKLDSISVVTGQPLEDDIRAELDLLRSELDMLKKAFRRHCLETM